MYKHIYTYKCIYIYIYMNIYTYTYLYIFTSIPYTHSYIPRIDLHICKCVCIYSETLT